MYLEFVQFYTRKKTEAFCLFLKYAATCELKNIFLFKRLSGNYQSIDPELMTLMFFLKMSSELFYVLEEARLRNTNIVGISKYLLLYFYY